MIEICPRYAAKDGSFLFLDVAGKTCKMFLISLTFAKIKFEHNIALEIASFGLAKLTLLNGGRTAHLVIKLQLNIQTNENSVCNIKKHSGMAKILGKCHIVI